MPSGVSEEELFGVRSALESKGVRVVVLSLSGQEARGMNRERFQPDGMIVDWNRQSGIQGKYHAVILVGGKGARKSLWDDPIVPQILTDHYRAGSVVGAIGSALVVLARAALITGEIPMPDEEAAHKELETLGAVGVDRPVTSIGNIVAGQGAGAVEAFAQTVCDLMQAEEVL
ncbi:MAG: DJ-1/PfpI family protein [Nitrospinae bacterium]|nr:DJ-1/PfpI family protein [Nitrospinota bacterium]